MAAKTTPEVDETAVARESPVRQAHAAAARRHGRSSAPGYLGVPLEELGEEERSVEEAEREAEESREDDDQEESRPRTRTRSRSRSEDDDEDSSPSGGGA